MVGLGLTMSAVAGVAPETHAANNTPLAANQRKRVKAFLKRCRINPRHSQIDLQAYLLLPVQRIPRYKLFVSISGSTNFMDTEKTLFSLKIYPNALLLRTQHSRIP